jgi:hypothetical protein
MTSTLRTMQIEGRRDMPERENRWHPGCTPQDMSNYPKRDDDTVEPATGPAGWP